MSVISKKTLTILGGGEGICYLKFGKTVPVCGLFSNMCKDARCTSPCKIVLKLGYQPIQAFLKERFPYFIPEPHRCFYYISC